MKFFSRSIHSSAAVRGALTSKPYAFVARPWELTTIDGIDNFGSLGANIQLQTRGNELLRILPRTNSEVNEPWIDDKTRFCYDGLKSQRLIKPLCRNLENPSQWDKDVFEWRDVLKRVKTTFDGMKKGDGINYRAICGGNIDLGTALALTDFSEIVSSNKEDFSVEVVSHGAAVTNGLPQNYRFNSSIVGLDEADLCLLVGTNFLVECPLLCARMRKGFLADTLQVAQIGFENGLSFPAEQLGLSPQTLVDLANGKHPFSEIFASAEKPMIVLDSSLFNRPDVDLVLDAVETLGKQTNLISKEDGWNGINFFHKNANDVGLLELGRSKPLSMGDETCDVLHLVHVQAEDLPNGSADVKKLRDQSKFIIYQGSHGDELAGVADIVLPSAAFTEHTGLYTNIEGRTQCSNKALAPPGLGKADWMILRALSEVLGAPLPYDTRDALEKRLVQFVPNASREGENLSVLVKNEVYVEGTSKLRGKFSDASALTVPLVPERSDFYLEGHPAARVSKVMARCSRDEHASHRNFKMLQG